MSPARPLLMLVLLVLFPVCQTLAASIAPTQHTCENRVPGQKQVYWGDLHVHTAYSLDAAGYGTVHTPADAFRFARGESLQLPGGSIARLDRPLDFMAITDHAEWLDFLKLCSESGHADHPTCQSLRENSTPERGGKVFGDFVVPSITKAEPAALAPCVENPAACEAASQSQWQRIQAQANAADTPCAFSALIGFEWSATRSFSHTHRNVIFRSDVVTAAAIDYIRYPTLESLFKALDRQCRTDDGCRVLTIPHNTNMSDGTSFDVLAETDELHRARTRYERLIEIFQEKGNSECLAPLGVLDESDCNLEIQLTNHSRPAKAQDYRPEAWERMRAGYVRGLLLRGLEAAASGSNPLQLGIVGATDTHAATPGFVEEALWKGSVFGIGNLDRIMTRLGWNPGGLTAVWAEQNTRADIFDALHRRETYATTGPRIRLRFEAGTHGESGMCDNLSDANVPVPMGGELPRSTRAPVFRISAIADRTPIAAIEIVKGTWRDGRQQQVVIGVWSGRGMDLCASWKDPDFRPDEPAFWYARIREQPSPRWSALMCQEAGRCEEFPGADRTVEERAWSSPIWNLPVVSAGE